MTSDLQDIPDNQQLRLENERLRAELSATCAAGKALQEENERLQAELDGRNADFDDLREKIAEVVGAHRIARAALRGTKL